mmetsp:Transcript_12402/g.29185  ORF Transcript_12402/g.29185 Transcript_12402/m.29185 type:complete len:570 (+) Transcript_12402:36-1745(+)
MAVQQQIGFVAPLQDAQALSKGGSNILTRPTSSVLARFAAVPVSQQTIAQGRTATAFVAPIGVCFLVAGLTSTRQRRLSRRGRCSVLRRSRTTGPGWVDEVARVLDPREEGPEWAKTVGYRGRKSVRILLDGEDLAHSYSAAMYDLTGKWIGPSSVGIEKALQYGAWAGGVPEDPTPDRGPGDRQLVSPEVMSFVAIPADMVEAISPGHILDGYPLDFCEALGRARQSVQGTWLNTWVSSLQEVDRLLTWKRPARVGPETPRPNTLLNQKYYTPYKPTAFKSLNTAPTVLSQCMGAGRRLRLGQRVEALKPAIQIEGVWQPSKWDTATVKAVNYDGTYDLKFDRNWGPFRDNRKYDLNARRVNLSLARNERFKENWGADSMPASFRLMQEMEHAEGMSPDQIRHIGSLDRLCELDSDEGSQDWFLVSSKDFMLTSSASSDSMDRLYNFKKMFQLDYRWVPNDDYTDLLFEPVPTEAMAKAILASHKDVVRQFKERAESLPENFGVPTEHFQKEDDQFDRTLEKVQSKMTNLVAGVHIIPDSPADTPSKPAGPTVKKKQIRVQKKKETAR